MLRNLQEKFCVEYAKCGNATQAYINAGYKAKGIVASVNASKLLRNANVQARLKELAEDIKTPKIMDAMERQQLLTNTINDCYADRDYLSMCKAMDILNKMQGCYVNKVELSGTVGIADELQEAWRRVKQHDKG